MLVLKTRPPVIPPGLVDRPRLFDTLTAGAKLPFTLVGAGPGSGKTLAVAAWATAAAADTLMAWLSLDDSDNDPGVFWSDLLFAITASGGVPEGSPLRDLIPGSSFGSREVVDVTARLAELPKPVVVVLDDFHEITNSEVLDTITRFVDHQPPTVRLVVLSRADPVLGLHRLRVNGQLTEIRASDLAFTTPETADLFASSGLQLNADQVATLQDRTGGWPVGLRLAAMSLDPADVAAGIERFSGTDQSVADYLVSEFTSRLSLRDREFLLRTSIVDRLSGDLADHLTGRSDGQLVLEGFVRDNAFVVGLGGHRDWFSYHPLLRELLQHRLRAEQPTSKTELHQAAARWLIGHGQPIEAIRQLIAAGDSAGAGKALLSVIPRILSADGPELAVAIEPLARTARDHPTLSALLASATCHFHRLEPAAMLQDAADARGYLDEAAQDVRPAAEVAILLFELAAARISGNSDGVIAIARQVLTLLDETARQKMPAARQFRIITVGNLGGALVWAGSADEAEQVLAEATPEALELGLLLPHLNSTGHLALLDTFQGRLRRGQRRASGGLEIIDRRGWASEPQALTTYVALSQIALARHQLAAAESYIQKGLAVSGQQTDRAGRLALAIAAVQVAVGRGTAAMAFAADARVVAGLGRTAHAADLLIRWSNIAGAEALLLDNRPAEALRRIGVPSKGLGFAACWERVTLARARMALDQLPAAADLIEPLLQPAMAYREPTIVAYLLRAVIAERDRHESGATAALAAAIDLAQPEGINRPFLLFGNRMTKQLVRYQSLDGPHRTFVGKLLEQITPTEPTHNGPIVIDPLTDRELMVLRYLPTMLKANEIGADLFVSVNTVKAHLRTMYRKLGVTNRREAVERARAIGLL
jgi:LuxR family maltose regulon positive regulatory protein